MAENRKDAENYLKKKKFTYGPVVSFGFYQGKTIEWDVLRISYGHFLLISRDIIGHKPYHVESDLTTWGKCSLQQWLNGEFLAEAFDAEERSMIDEVETDSGYHYSHMDKIFALSRSEIYDLAIDKEIVSCGSKYWLRSEKMGNVDVVLSGGIIDYAHKDDPNVGVRPVMWVDVN